MRYFICHNGVLLSMFALAATQYGCIRVATAAQIELAANEDMTCARDIQKDVDANVSFENVLTDPVVDADCVQATKDTGLAIADIVEDIAAKSPNTAAGKEAVARKAARAAKK
jgi:hypothetical protein